jgi:hypothetical protein
MRWWLRWPRAAKATRLSVAGNQVPHFFVFGDLRPGMTYRLRVAGVSAIGQGKWSATTVSTTTLATPPAQPQPPAVDPRHVELFSLRVGWTSPDEHGSAPQPSRSCVHHSLWVTVAFKTVSSVRDPTGLLRRRRFFHGTSQFFLERLLSIIRCPPKRIMNVFFSIFLQTYAHRLFAVSISWSSGESRRHGRRRSRSQGPLRGDGGARRTAACASRASSWGPPTRSAWPLATRSAAGPGRRGRQTSTSPRSASETLWTNGAIGF